MAEGKRKTGQSTGTWLTIVFLVILLLALLVAAFYGWRALRTWKEQDAKPETESEAPPGPSFESAERAIGETLDTKEFAIRVLSAGPAQLPPEMGEPPAGTARVAVRVSVRNKTDAPIALNATPFAAHQTALLVGEAEYPGALFVGAVKQAREGTVPANAELTLRFVFEVPERSREATFVWTPTSEERGYPKLVVPIPDVSSESGTP